MTFNDATIANIQAARTINGVPPEHYQSPVSQHPPSALAASDRDP